MVPAQDPELEETGKNANSKPPVATGLFGQVALHEEQIKLSFAGRTPIQAPVLPVKRDEEKVKTLKKKVGVSTAGFFRGKKDNEALDLKDSKLLKMIENLLTSIEPNTPAERRELIDRRLADFCDSAKVAKWQKSEYLVKDNPCYRDLNQGEKKHIDDYDDDGNDLKKTIEEISKWDDFGTLVASPNGKFAAAITGLGKVVVFNLDQGAGQPASYRIMKDFNTGIDARKETESVRDFADRVDENYIKNRPELASQIKIIFSPDSETLFVSSVFETGAYDLRYFNDVQKVIEYVSIIPYYQDMERKRGPLMFQYFYKTTFAGSLYTPIDREVLVVGCTKDIQFVIFCLDNFKKGEKNFLPPFNVIPTSHKSYVQIFGVDKNSGKGQRGQANEDEEDKIVNVAHNCSNYLLLERDTKRKKRLECYKMDFDNLKNKGKVGVVFKVDIPIHITLFMKTVLPSGQEVYCFNSKKSEIQILKVNDKKLEFESVFRLAGKRKNLKHLAVKGDGKYLLIVDTALWAEVFIKTVKGYTLIHSFDANIIRKQVTVKGTTEPVKGMTEQDLSDMDFLEDGSGIVSICGITMVHQQLNLPGPLPARCLYTNSHFFNMNLRKRLNGSYSVWQSMKDAKYQKIVDFDPDTNGGCIVRTFKENHKETFFYSIEDILKPLGNIYQESHVEQEKGGKDGNDGKYPQQKKQLEDFLMGEQYSNDVMVFHIPPLNQVVFLLKKNNKVIAFDKNDLYKYMADAADPSKKPEFPKAKGSFDHDIELYDYDAYQVHLGGAFYDSKGNYLLMRLSDDEHDEGVALMTVGMPKILSGAFFFPLDKNRILVSKVEPESEYSAKEGEPNYPGALQIYNLTTNKLEGEETILKVEAFFKFMVDTPNENVKALIGDNLFGLYDVEKGKLLSHEKVFSSDNEDIPVSLEFDTHCFLQSPDKKYIVLTSFSDCEKTMIYSIDGTTSKKRSPNFSNKARQDLLNRWCFSHDSKYLLTLVNDHIVVFMLSSFQAITKIHLDAEFTKFGKILQLNLYDFSTELEIAVGHKNHIFFKRLPFYPKARDLLFADVAKKMAEYEKKDDDLLKNDKSKELNEILISMPVYQRYLDTTYLKLLCLTDDSLLIKSYFDGLKDTKDVIFNSHFSRLVTVDTKVMKKEAVSCFIELLEYTVQTDGEMPNIDTKILLDWLRSNQMKLTDVRRLMHLITFRPCNVTLTGDPKDEDKLMVPLPTNDKGKEEQGWVDHVQKEVFQEDSANHTTYDLYRTAIKFDFTIGSRFSIDYFKWMENMTDEDLKTIYKPIIYYKWEQIYWFAIVYSVMVWILNALVCAFMAFAFDQWGVAIPIIILSSLFLGYEVKCISADPTDSVYDPWTYVDILLHLFIISCTLAVIIGGGSNPNYSYNWLRVTAFVLTSFRGMTMLRIFSGTRYFITMLFMTFRKMMAFLSVFAYIIFIYWFVCLVRPSLVPGGEDEAFYPSVQQSLNIAFSNFSADVDSVIVLITTIIGNVVLSLVLLNYLIAIISNVYEEISEERDLYDVRMLLDIIVEFECFFMWKKSLVGERELEYCVARPRQVMSESLSDMKQVYSEEKKVLENDMKEAIKAHEKDITAVIETASKDNIEVIKRELDNLKKKLIQMGVETKLNKFIEKEKDKEISKEIKDKVEKKRNQLEKEAEIWKKNQEKEANGDTTKLNKIKSDYEAKLKKIEEKIMNYRERLKEDEFEESEASEIES
jgi:hypothetical protein